MKKSNYLWNKNLTQPDSQNVGSYMQGFPVGDSGSYKTKWFAFLENIFQKSECTQSNQNEKRMQNIIVGCDEGVHSIT